VGSSTLQNPIGLHGLLGDCFAFPLKKKKKLSRVNLEFSCNVVVWKAFLPVVTAQTRPYIENLVASILRANAASPENDQGY
jgi:hypothetical protein